MRYYLDKLDNGLRVLTVPMPGLDSATVTVWVRTGSRNETPRTSGISHFLEHMAFKGTTKRPTPKKIAEEIDSIGGVFNASTHKEWTNFYIKVPTKKIETAFNVLSDMLLDPLLKQNDIDRERGVITEEIGMYEDTPMRKIPDIFEQLIFAGTVLGRDIIGKRETVNSVKRPDFVKYRNKYYYGKNIVLAVAGGVTSKRVANLAQKYFSNVKSVKKPLGFNTIQPRGFTNGPRVKLSGHKSKQAHFILGFRGTPRGHKDRFTESIIATILGGGMSSRLFTEIREKRGLAYAVKSGTERYMDAGYIETYAGVDPKRIDEAIRVALEEHYKITNHQSPITSHELAKAKEYLKGHIALSLEDTSSVNSFFALGELMLGKIDTPKEVYSQIDKVTIKDIQKVAQKLFVPKGLNLAIIGPYKDDNRFLRLLK